MMKKWLITASILVAGLGMAWHHWRIRDAWLQWRFDIRDNPPSHDMRQSQELLKSLPQLPYTLLQKEYLTTSYSDLPKYKRLLKSKRYYLLKREDLYRHIVGTFRVKDFVAKDRFYRELILGKRTTIPWLISSDLLKAIHHLRKNLSQKNFNPDAFHIRSAHRPPHHNEAVGGASLSRHIKGEAVDIFIKDIDGSGGYTPEDKKIVLDLLEHRIIRSMGGIGRYPHSRVVHFDVRGYRARWDKMK